MRWIFLLILVPSMLALTGCASEAEARTPEDLVGEIADNIDAMNALLASVNDVASAKAAAPQLKQLHDRWQYCEERMHSMDEPDAETLQRIEQVYERRITYSMLALMDNVMRLNDQPEVMDELEDALPFTGW